MGSVFSIAVRMSVVTLVLTGLLYPLAVTGLAQVLFGSKANGSLVTDDRGAIVGSELIGQSFANAAYFQPRPSAAGPNGYDGAASSGTNLGPTSKKLRDGVAATAARLRLENPAAAREVPAGLVHASASGLDPHVSPDDAHWQIARVAAARQVAPERVISLVVAAEEGRDLGVLGEPRVNVLMLNLALDKTFGRPVPSGPSIGGGGP